MPNEALFTQGGTYDAAELRKLIKGIWYSPSPGGVVDGLAVTVGGSLTISVSAGFAKIDDTSNGAYLGYSTSSTAVTISSNSGGGSTRSDTIYAKANDPGAGGTAGELVISVATGTSTIPSLAIALGTVAVTTANTMTVTTGARVLAEPQNTAARGTYASLAARLAALDAALAAGQGAAVTTTGVQTLTNKDMSSATNTFPPGVVLPPGMVVAYGGTVAPAGWLLCAGQTVSRTGANAALFAAVGISYGAGDGISTFAVPDLRGRVIAAPDNMGGSAAGRLTSLTPVGSFRGTQSITLDANQLPTHTHSATVGTDSPDHSHSIAAHNHGGATGNAVDTHTHGMNFQWTNTTQSGGGTIRVTDIQNQTGGGGTSATATTGSGSGLGHTHSIPSQALASGNASARHSHSVSISAAGASAAVPTVQPTLALSYIIKL